jgi:hypothetical protein
MLLASSVNVFGEFVTLGLIHRFLFLYFGLGIGTLLLLEDLFAALSYLKLFLLVLPLHRILELQFIAFHLD